MDVYDFSFFFSTMWVGPFWIAMLLYPEHEKTEKLMNGSWFFLGPIVMWYLISFSDISGLMGLVSDTLDPSNALQGLAELLGTKPGASAAWSHMVAGDIFVTRWIWKRCIEENCDRWKLVISVFFGVMLMPLGIVLNLILVKR
jgi:hypothetical protein|tara:strand:+ start:1755 stop:2183 length:429 start_codon:yes stop_codon:yes gene_type:complete